MQEPAAAAALHRHHEAAVKRDAGVLHRLGDPRLELRIDGSLLSVAGRRGVLRVLTLDGTGAPADVTKTGPRPEQKAAPFVLIVGSPNLLVGDDGDGLACTVTYQARRAASASIEAELDALVGRIDADYDGLS